MAKDIKALRAQTGLSQIAFCKKYNIPLRTLQHWEAKTRIPAEYIIDLIERVIDLDYPPEETAKTE